MELQLLVLAAIFGMSSAGSRVMFEENGIFIKLHSVGLVNLGYIHELDDKDYDVINVLNLYFRELRYLDPGNNDLFFKQNPRFHVDSKRFYTFREASVHGMSMQSNMTSLGVTLKLSTMIFKANAQLKSGAHRLSDVSRGDVMVSLEVTPAHDDVTEAEDAAVCIPCDMAEDHVIQFGVDVTHSGAAETDDVTDGSSYYERRGYADGAVLFVPKKVLLDGEPYEANTRTTESENKHSMVFRLPAPLRNSMEVDLLFNVNLEQNAQLEESDPEQNVQSDGGDPEQEVEAGEGEIDKDDYSPADYPRSPGEAADGKDVRKDDAKVLEVEIDETSSQNAEYVVAASTDVEGKASASNICLSLLGFLSISLLVML